LVGVGGAGSVSDAVASANGAAGGAARAPPIAAAAQMFKQRVRH